MTLPNINLLNREIVTHWPSAPANIKIRYCILSTCLQFYISYSKTATGTTFIFILCRVNTPRQRHIVIQLTRCSHPGSNKISDMCIYVSLFTQHFTNMLRALKNATRSQITTIVCHARFP